MLTLWDARNDSRSLRQAMNRFLEQGARREGLPTQHRAAPGFALDVVETADHYVVTASMPGCSKEKVEISFEDDTLTIQGTLNEAPPKEAGSEEGRGEEGASQTRYLVRERFTGQVRRSLAFPVRIEAGSATAEYKDGVLTLTLPKSEAAKPRTIKIGL